MDFNIIARNQNESVENLNLIEQIKTAFKLGYEVVALNTIIEGKCLEGKDVNIPEPLTIQLGNDANSEILLGKKNYRILNRLTSIVSDNYHVHRMMRSPVTKKYDLLALEPTNFKLYQHLCGQLDFDIMTLDFTTRLPFHLRHNNCKQAMQNGIHFEIQYSPCLRDSSIRSMVIANANILSEVVRGKKIILTSGSIKAMELRSPKDISNLGLLFGMSQEQSNASVNQNCQTVLTHSEVRRKTGLGVVSVVDIAKVAPSEKWLKEACTYLVKLEEEADEPSQKLLKLDTT